MPIAKSSTQQRRRHLPPLVSRAALSGMLSLAAIAVFGTLWVESAPPQARPPIDVGEIESSVHNLVNQHRQSIGLSPLELNAVVSREARQHSQAMATRQVSFSHQGFSQRTDALTSSVPWRRAAENIAFSQGYSDPAQRAMSGWLDSPGHRSSMEGDFNVTGIGAARNESGQYFITQLFLKVPRSASSLDETLWAGLEPESAKGGFSAHREIPAIASVLKSSAVPNFEPSSTRVF